MLAIAAGLPYQGKQADFPDVDKKDEMSPYIAALYDISAIRGFPDGSFRPGENITRGQAAKIVALAFGIREGDLINALTDLPEELAVKTAIEMLASNGIVKGYEDKLFKPFEKISRAEFSKIVCLAMVVAAIQKAEENPTTENLTAAQALLNGLPKDQDQATRTYLQGRLDEAEGEQEAGPPPPLPPIISVDPEEVYLLPDGSFELALADAPADWIASWSSSDESIATVDKNGMVTALAAGQARIRATAGGGTAECKVVVLATGSGAVYNKTNNASYANLNAAITVASSGDELFLVGDSRDSGLITLTTKLIIDGQGHAVDQAVFITRSAKGTTIKNFTGIVNENPGINGLTESRKQIPSAFIIAAEDIVLDKIEVKIANDVSLGRSTAVIGFNDAKFTVRNSNFENVMRGIYAHYGHGAAGAYQNVVIALNNTFTNVWSAICGTERTDLTAVGNKLDSVWTSGKDIVTVPGEGLALGNGVRIRDLDGALIPWREDVDFLKVKNTFANTADSLQVIDHRLSVENETRRTYYFDINSALVDANSGDTLLVASGTYDGNVKINKSNLTLKSAAGAERTTLNGVVDITGENVTLEGFTIRPGLGRCAMSIQASATIKSNQIFAQDSQEGIYIDAGVGAVIRILGNKIEYGGESESNLAGIRVVTKPQSINDKTSEEDIISALESNNTITNFRTKVVFDLPPAG
ncbi:MAG: hypothetical protein GX763_07025 [Clostridiaceae bacterium]|nr:hypothetical protein [Clostridiaceae bacterium]